MRREGGVKKFQILVCIDWEYSLSTIQMQTDNQLHKYFEFPSLYGDKYSEFQP